MAKVLPQANGHGGPLVKSKPKIQMRRKTKGACRTCKVRKVKCDEGRPCCNRCQSTGRICEGYGICESFNEWAPEVDFYQSQL